MYNEMPEAVMVFICPKVFYAALSVFAHFFLNWLQSCHPLRICVAILCINLYPLPFFNIQLTANDLKLTFAALRINYDAIVPRYGG